MNTTEECDYCGCPVGVYPLDHSHGCPIPDPEFMDSWREGYMAALDGEDCHVKDWGYICGWTRRIGEVISEQI